MGLIQCDFISLCLNRDVHFNILLPDAQKAPYPFRTLYLLHGFGGTSQELFGISEMCEKYGIAIVMPDGENSFYLDNPVRNENFGRYVGKELVEFTRRVFPLSHERRDTFIGGFSMGGFGALLNGLSYSETFGGIIGISPAIVTGDTDDPALLPYSGKAPDYKKSGDILFSLVNDLSGTELPDIYFCCGKNDLFVRSARALDKLLTDNGVVHTYEETPGAHTASYFYPMLDAAVSRLPLGYVYEPPIPFFIEK